MRRSGGEGGGGMFLSNFIVVSKIRHLFEKKYANYI